MKKLIVSLLIVASFASCSKDDNNPETKDKAVIENHPNDKVKDNGNGTSGVTLGNVGFTTKQVDFSNEPVVTDSKTISADAEETFAINMEFSRFKIDNEYIVAAENNKILLYDMNNKVIKDEFKTSFDITGFDYNGAIITVEAGTDVNFYNIKDNAVEKQFFHIPRFHGSMFLNNCYLDHDRAYVVDADELLSFPLDDTKTIKKESDIPSFGKYNFTSDENNLYISVGHVSKPDPNNPNAAYLDYSIVRILNKANGKTADELESALNKTYSGITVDANYIYLSIKNDNEILVYNKHNFKASGSIKVDSPTSIVKVGEYIYIHSATPQSIIKYKVSFK